MEDSSGNMSIDFLAAFTIFIIAFIWVATMIPGLLVGLSAHGIDYDAVAYRTAVILAEDPGATIPVIYTPWEQENAAGKGNIDRFGLAISKDTPNILSRQKVERFFSSDFVYPDDYRKKVIFGDYPYRFNISLLERGGVINQTGDPIPEGNYGFIRREVMIKGYSNATIDYTDYKNYKSYNKNTGTSNNLDINATTHDFAIQINRTELLHGDITEPPINPSYNAAYRIDPRRDWIIINITDTDKRFPAEAPIPSWVSNASMPATPNVPLKTLKLTGVRLSQSDDDTTGPVTMAGYDNDFLWVGNTLIDGVGNSLPQDIAGKDITLKFKPGFFGGDVTDNAGSIYINMTFYTEADCSANCDPATASTHGMPYLNTSESGPWQYNYSAVYVTQPELTNAVLEVAVW
jgi:hypothetical protein